MIESPSQTAVLDARKVHLCLTGQVRGFASSAPGTAKTIKEITESDLGPVALVAPKFGGIQNAIQNIDININGSSRSYNLEKTSLVEQKMFYNSYSSYNRLEGGGPSEVIEFFGSGQMNYELISGVQGSPDYNDNKNNGAINTEVVLGGTIPSGLNINKSYLSYTNTNVIQLLTDKNFMARYRKFMNTLAVGTASNDIVLVERLTCPPFWNGQRNGLNKMMSPIIPHLNRTIITITFLPESKMFGALFQCPTWHNLYKMEYLFGTKKPYLELAWFEPGPNVVMPQRVQLPIYSVKTHTTKFDNTAWWSNKLTNSPLKVRSNLISIDQTPKYMFIYGQLDKMASGATISGITWDNYSAFFPNYNGTTTREVGSRDVGNDVNPPIVELNIRYKLNHNVFQANISAEQLYELTMANIGSYQYDFYTWLHYNCVIILSDSQISDFNIPQGILGNSSQIEISATFVSPRFSITNQFNGNPAVSTQLNYTGYSDEYQNGVAPSNNYATVTGVLPRVYEFVVSFYNTSEILELEPNRAMWLSQNLTTSKGGGSQYKSKFVN